MAMVSIDAGLTSERRTLGARFMDWMERVAESSHGARAARRYMALNALSDAELAKRGITREELPELCFGYHRWG